jgi:hypothetical protein
MPTTEIEKLERRYAENPQGLTFAPLAEVHRKNGDIPRAMELLRAGLELHPNYIPASIVLGRCHWDLGDLPAAESAFAHVLRLDDENVIALKSLADINERLGRLGEAQRWLNRLIAVDRSNEEARQQLARLETAKQDPKRGAPAEPPPPSELPHEIAAAQHQPAAPPEPPLPVATQPPAPEPAKAAAPTPITEETPALDLTSELAEPKEAGPPVAAESKSPTLEFLDPSGPSRGGTDNQVSTPAPGVDGLISQEFVPPKGASIPLHPELTQELVPSDADFDRLEVETAEDVELQSSGASEFRVPNAAEDFLDSPAERAPALLPASDDYQPPVHGEKAPEPPAAAAEEPARPQEPTKPSYAARDTKGQSVASFFSALLAARPLGSATGARAAADASGTMSQTSRDAAAPHSDAALDATVSFDEFFGSASGSSAVPQANSDQGKDDLDQFQSWLQNLKR